MIDSEGLYPGERMLLIGLLPEELEVTEPYDLASVAAEDDQHHTGQTDEAVVE